ncbi:pyrethroid hydrolase Ces2a isoform X1 [Procambarus clarkii]|uniref:pyrethroid hydrolase Ces2a isoform X1 n=2 Tax=Procambarus clarkii TaxID=6728 RepID=UPI0037428725
MKTEVRGGKMKMRTYVVVGMSVGLSLLALSVWLLPQGYQQPELGIQTAPLADQPEVQLTAGRVSGSKEIVGGDRIVYLFKGIPYARPPLGRLRFKAPLAPKPWKGVRECTSWPSVCPYAFFDNNVNGREDCLYLNVFTPLLEERDAKLPVMVYIHGGAFQTGGATNYHYMPLLTQDVVLVTIHYRLGVLGFLSTEDEVLPGNLGLRDQTLALAWVRDNIAHFGGDTERVTIFGNSAGSASVHLLMFNPHAKGLFSRAIMQSGSALDPWVVRNDHKSVAFKIGQMIGCPTPDVVSESNTSDSKALKRCLQKASLSSLVPASRKFSIWCWLPWVAVPRVDGDHLPDHPAALLKEGRFHHVPVISGVSQHEGVFITSTLYRSKNVQEELVHKFQVVGPRAALLFQEGDNQPLTLARLVFQHYVGDVRARDTDKDALIQLFGDRLFNIGHDETLLFTSRHQQQPVFAYEMKYLQHGQKYVLHSQELQYLFKRPGWDPRPGKSDKDDFSQLMVKLWTNFATKGDPTPDDSLGFRWEAMSDSSTTHLRLAPSPLMENDTREEARQFWASLPTRHNQLLYPERANHYLAFFDNLKNIPSNKLVMKTAEQ